MFQRVDDLKQEWKGRRGREAEREQRSLSHDRRWKEKENTHGWNPMAITCDHRAAVRLMQGWV